MLLFQVATSHRIVGGDQSYPDCAPHRLVQHFSRFVFPTRAASRRSAPGGGRDGSPTGNREPLDRVPCSVAPARDSAPGLRLDSRPSYGDIPLNGFEAVLAAPPVPGHRAARRSKALVDLPTLMLEERWLGRYASAASTKEEGFDLLGRIRYQVRLQHPIASPATASHFTSPPTTNSSSALART